MTLPIGAAIRHVRKTRGLSISELARRAGLTRVHVSKMEHGRTSPGIETLVNLAVGLQVEPHKLVKLICQMGCLGPVNDKERIADKALT